MPDLPSPRPSASFRDYLMLHFIVVIWGATALIGKNISLAAPVIVFWRTGLACLALFLILLARKESPRLPALKILMLLGAGCVIGTHWMLFFLAVKISSVSICLIGIATNSLWCALLEPLIKKNHGYRPLEIVLSLCALFGAIIVFYGDPISLPGLLTGMLAALVVAIFSYMNEHLTSRHRACTIAFYEMGGACLFMGVLLPITLPMLGGAEQALWPDARSFVFLLVLALVCTVYAFTVNVELLRRIPVFTISLAGNLEPVYGIIMAAIFLAEYKNHGPSFYLGGGLILTAALAYPVLSKRFRHGRPPTLPNQP